MAGRYIMTIQVTFESELSEGAVRLSAESVRSDVQDMLSADDIAFGSPPPIATLQLLKSLT